MCSCSLRSLCFNDRNLFFPLSRRIDQLSSPNFFPREIMPTLAVSDFNVVCATLGGFVTVFGLVSYLLKEQYYLSEACEFRSVLFSFPCLRACSPCSLLTTESFRFPPSHSNLPARRHHILPACHELHQTTCLRSRVRRILGVHYPLLQPPGPWRSARDCRRATPQQVPEDGMEVAVTSAGSRDGGHVAVQQPADFRNGSRTEFRA